VRIYHLFPIVVLAAAVPSLDAKDKKPKSDPQDAIEVIAHIPATSGPVRRFMKTQHYSSQYLYVEHDAGQGVTLIDITNATHPLVLGEVSYPANGGYASLVAVTGTAALVTDQSAPVSSTAQSIHIMDLMDPKNPTVAREFTGVTAIARDELRRLVFVANGDGIWILHQSFAQDPQVDRAYDYYIRYGSSMYPR
jgi:hypothetical protein